MTGMRVVYHLTRADLLERVRHRSFLMVMGVTVYAGYLTVPAREAPYNALVIAGHRGYYNAAWVGTVFGVVASTVLTLLGFYLVRDSIARDYSTRVGQIVATTPVTGPAYVAGKWLSNLLVLTAILMVSTGMAAVMLLARGESGGLNLGALVMPIWFMGLPTVAIVAAMAVLFESTASLRGGAGNVAYFFIWVFALLTTVGRMLLSVGDIVPHNDLAGLSRSMVDIRQQMIAAGLDLSHGATDLAVPTRGHEVARFLWSGVDWSAGIVLERSIWLVLAAAIALSAAIPFDRFDPARGRTSGRQRREEPSRAPGFFRRSSPRSIGPPDSVAPETDGGGVPGTVVDLTPVTNRETCRRFWPVLIAELRLIVRGHAWWWFAVALGLVIASLFSPQQVVQRVLFPAAWLWPILGWSALGSREARHHTRQIVFSTPHSVRRQLIAMWLGGLLLAVVTGSGACVRLVFAGEWGRVVAFGIGAAFVPALALALGVWSGGGRLFEVLYVVWWYVGSIDRVPALDFMGVTPQGVAEGVPAIYLLAAIVLVSVAIAGRRRQLY